MTKQQIQRIKKINKKSKNNKYLSQVSTSKDFRDFSINFLSEYLSDRDFEIAMILANNFVTKKEQNNPCDYVLKNLPSLNPKVQALYEKGVFLYDAITIVNEKEKKLLYEKFLKEGYDVKTASIFANINNLDNYNTDELKTLIDNVSKISDTGNSDISAIIDKILSDGEIDLKSFNEYISKINIEELLETAPNMKNYDFKQMITFLNLHYKLNPNKTEFNKADLTIENLTDFLSHNYVNADSLTNLLTIYPNTKREVGELPKGWTDNIPEKDKPEKIKEIYDAILDFENSQDITKLKNRLENILSKSVEINFIKRGTFALAYKISVEGEKDTCLKIFHTESIPLKNIHGMRIEPQLGFLLNNYSNDFVKIYFGKVAGDYNNDGFLVTQYLDKNTIPETSLITEEGYIFVSNDVDENNNITHGKIIDFGDIEAFKIPSE